MRQMFAIECLIDGEWKIPIMVIGEHAEVEADLPGFSAKTGFPMNELRLRWIWCKDEAIRLEDSGIKVYGKPEGGPILWLS